MRVWINRFRCLVRRTALPRSVGGPELSYRVGRSALRSDIHEEASVKTGARRSRDFPDIHSASSALAERHEGVCGRSHSIPRRRDAPRRTSGCDLGPATDLDLDSLLPAGPVCAGPGCWWKPANMSQYNYQFV